MKTLCKLKVNGDAFEIAVSPATTLLETLRYELSLTGSKQGCDKGDCGACTVMVNGQAVLACLTLAVSVQNAEIVTVEGLATAQGPHPLQDAFDRLGAAQCGFCTPGMLMSAAALLKTETQPSRERIASALSGNLCRCTGYTKIIDAVEVAATEMHQDSTEVSLDDDEVAYASV